MSVAETHGETQRLSVRLTKAGLRPTRQRLALATLLYGAGDRHVTAEQLHKEAGEANITVSLATVYNTLHQFTESGLLREVVVESGRSYFDTNTTDHHHFFIEDELRLTDIQRKDRLRESSRGAGRHGDQTGRSDHPPGSKRALRLKDPHIGSE